MNLTEIDCVACGGEIVFDLELKEAEIACPSCGAVHQIEEIEETPEPDAEWNPDADGEDTTRVFGEGSTEAAAVEVPAVRPRKRPVAAPLLLLSMAATGGFLYWAWQEQMKREALMEARVESLEKRLGSASPTVEGSLDPDAALFILQENLDELDETVSRLGAMVRTQHASALQGDYTMRHSQKNLMRQETEVGKLALKVGMIEREVADKSKHAREAFELSVKRRKEAEQAAVPMRRRIGTLEEQRDRLFAQYRAAAVPRRPPGVVSTRRATEMMKDWEIKVAPVLEQLQSQITRVRESIEDEEAKIDGLFQDPTLE